MPTRRRRRAGRPTAEEAALVPERLLDAATWLFARRGFGGTSMEAIARRAGASSKTVYSRYASKQEVLRAVVRRLFDRAVRSEAPAAEAEPTATPRQTLLTIGRELAALSAAQPTAGVNRLILAEAFQVSELADLFIDLHARASAIVRQPLERWRADGTLPASPDPALAAPIFVEMVASLPRLRAMLGKPLAPEEVDRLVGTAVDLFLAGCGGPEPDAAGPGVAR
jgi:AcrR family transcriptional regulator